MSVSSSIRACIGSRSGVSPIEMGLAESNRVCKSLRALFKISVPEGVCPLSIRLAVLTATLPPTMPPIPPTMPTASCVPASKMSSVLFISPCTAIWSAVSVAAPDMNSPPSANAGLEIRLVRLMVFLIESGTILSSAAMVFWIRPHLAAGMAFNAAMSPNFSARVDTVDHIFI